MKKILILCALMSINSLKAQTFFDNFDSYTAGDYMADQSDGEWSTWSEAPGTDEDVLVSDADAFSGSNSCYFSSNLMGGGPTDIIRSFGILNTGLFSMDFNIKVPTGKSAYFNFQGNEINGNVYSMECFFNDDGSLLITNQIGLSFSVPAYTHDSWFNFKMDIDFNENVWEVFLDSVSQGTFTNQENQIASIDIFPVDQNSPYSCGFYIDDFEYTITPYTLPSLNAAVDYVTYAGGSLAGNSVLPVVTVKNSGINTIASFDLTTNYNGINYTQSYSGLSIASLVTNVFSVDEPIILITGANNLTATVSNVNNSIDEDLSDEDRKSTRLNSSHVD